MIRVRTLGHCAIQIDSTPLGPNAEIVFAALLDTLGVQFLRACVPLARLRLEQCTAGRSADAGH